MNALQKLTLVVEDFLKGLKNVITLFFTIFDFDVHDWTSNKVV